MHGCIYQPYPDTWPHVSVQRKMMMTVSGFTIQCAFVRRWFVPILMEHCIAMWHMKYQYVQSSLKYTAIMLYVHVHVPHTQGCMSHTPTLAPPTHIHTHLPIHPPPTHTQICTHLPHTPHTNTHLHSHAHTHPSTQPQSSNTHTHLILQSPMEGLKAIDAITQQAILLGEHGSESVETLQFSEEVQG